MPVDWVGRSKLAVVLALSTELEVFPNFVVDWGKFEGEDFEGEDFLSQIVESHCCLGSLVVLFAVHFRNFSS